MPATTPNRRVAGLQTAVPAGLSQAREAFEVAAGGIWTALARFAGWLRNVGHRRASGRGRRASDPARTSAATAPSPRSIGEAVRLAVAPGEIDAAYRITSVSRGRDRELWVVESRFGPR